LIDESPMRICSPEEEGANLPLLEIDGNLDLGDVTVHSFDLGDDPEPLGLFWLAFPSDHPIGQENTHIPVLSRNRSLPAYTL
jgi:hypothetical protein